MRAARPDGPLDRLPALVIPMVLGFAMAVFFLCDWHVHRPQPGQQIRTGQVVSRDKVSIGPASRPMLTIQVDGLPMTVKAVLMASASHNVPDRVSFYFPPVDASDVSLIEETSSLTVALMMFGLSAACAGLMVFMPRWYGRERSRGRGKGR